MEPARCALRSLGSLDLEPLLQLLHLSPVLLRMGQSVREQLRTLLRLWLLLSGLESAQLQPNYSYELLFRKLWQRHVCRTQCRLELERRLRHNRAVDERSGFPARITSGSARSRFGQPLDQPDKGSELGCRDHCSRLKRSRISSLTISLIS